MTITRDRITGMFLGIAIGDALGKPTESNTLEGIQKRYGRITDYLDCSSHKYFDDDHRGTTTDDWQLTKATAEGIIQTGCLDLNAIAAWHVEEYKKSVRGWGKTTKEAVARLAQGVPWTTSGKTKEPKRGTGNGIPMKIAPLGAYMAITNPQCEEPAWGQSVQDIENYTRMTHNARMAVQSGLCQAFAIFKCLTSDPADFRVDSFINCVVGAALMGKDKRFKKSADEGDDDLHARMKLLYQYEEYDAGKIVTDLKGSCYIYDSLPFTYMFFVRNPLSIESLYDVVSAGGDTDSNGSMLAGLLGALHGSSIFPRNLVDGLKEFDVVFDVAERFCDKLNVN
jgi:ADP-ribosylglycohydrolase